MPRKNRSSPKHKAKERAYHARPEQKKRRAQRNKARKAAERAGRVKKGDGKEVHHVNATSKSLGKKTRVISRRRNRQIGPGKARRRAAGKK